MIKQYYHSRKKGQTEGEKKGSHTFLYNSGKYSFLALASRSDGYLAI